MSFLDPLGDKPALVIDIGHMYTKCGFAGETGPHSIIPSKLNGNSISSNLSLGRPVNVYDYTLPGKKPSTAQSAGDFVKPTEASKQETVLREILVEFLHKIYYKILNVNSRERKVIIVESILTPTTFRSVLSEVLLKNFQAISVSFITSHQAAMFTLGISTALVVDCGHFDSQIMPIAENVPIIGLCDYVNLGSKRLHEELKRLVFEYAQVTVQTNERAPFKQYQSQIQLTDDTLEDILLRCCFVTTHDRSQQFRAELNNNSAVYLESKSSQDLIDLAAIKFKFALDCDYALPGNVTLHIPGYVREMTCDVLFNDRVDSSQTIPNLILDTLVRCPIDLKKPLSENVVLMGGLCMLTGFKSRLVSELNHLLRHADLSYASKLSISQFRFHVPPAQDNYTGWLGGAIFGSLDVSIDPLNI